MRMWFSSLVIGCALSASAFAAETGDDDLGVLILEALNANPSIGARVQRYESAQALVDSAGSWSDPMVTVEYSNVPVNSFALSGHPMAGLQVKVQQTLRPLKWSGQSRSVAQLRSDSVQHAVSEVEVALQGQVEAAYWQLTQVRQLRAVTQDHVRLTGELLGAVEARYVTGNTGQHSVLRLQVLRDGLEDSLSDYERSAEVWTAHLNGLLAREGGDYQTALSSSPLPAPEVFTDFIQQAKRDRPTQARLNTERRAQESAARLSQLDAKIDPSVWLGYRMRTVQTATDSGTDLVSVGLGLPLPVGSRKRANSSEASHIAAAQASKLAQESDLLQVSAELESVTARWRRAAQKAEFYTHKLLPSAETTLETALSDYTVGKADFASLFDAEVALLELTRGQIGAIIDTHLADARVRALTGSSQSGEKQ